VYNWAPRRPKDFISDVSVFKDGREVLRKSIRVNDPLRYEGFSFFQASYDMEALNWSGLRISNDPGVMVVYSGFILLIIGLVVIFYVNPLITRR
jgi:cytochrome c biogenesis protein ResB